MSFINDVSSELLFKWINREILLGGLETLNRQKQEKVVYALFGNSLLNSVSRRTDLLFHCNEEKFSQFCERLKVPEDSGQKYDLSTQMACKPWSEMSALAMAFRSIFKIEDTYMPITESLSETVSLIEPVSLVPPAYDYQLEVAGKIKLFLKSNRSAALMQLPTGAGKTRVTIQAIVETLWDRDTCKDSFVWLAHTQELCAQAHDTFRRLWIANGNAAIKTYCLWGSRKAKINATQPSAIFATFGTFASLYDRDELDDLAPKLHCVVVDEAHRASSRIFGRVLRRLKEQVKILGLTATPGRHAESHSANIELKDLFDSELISSSQLGEDPIAELQRRGILAVPKIQFIEGSDVELFAKASGEVGSETLQVLSYDEGRNQIIIDKIAGLAAGGHKVLIFSCSVEHSKILVAGLAGLDVIANYVDSNMSSGRRMSVIDSFSRGESTVLLNYGILSTGFDVPDISAVVITRPTSSIVLYSQMLGRGMRGPKAGGSEDFIGLDIRDNTDSFGGVNEVYNYFEGLWDSNL